MTPKKPMDVPLRIGIVHCACPPVVGGVEEVLSRTADTFHRLGIKLLGYDILFLLTGAYDPREERAVAYY